MRKLNESIKSYLPVITNHVLKQLLGDKMVFSSTLLLWSDWTSCI